MNTLSPSTPGRPVTKRALDKCDHCRVKKIKCLPETRDFDSGERCQPCVKANKPCNANTRVARRSAQSIANTPASVEIFSPAGSFIGSTGGEPPDVRFNGLHLRSPSQIFENVTSPSHLRASIYEAESWRPEDGSFLRATELLRILGSLVDLYKYCQQRNRSLFEMRQAYCLLNLDTIAAFLDPLLQVTYSLALSTLKEVLQIIQTSRFTPAEEELLNRRALDTGHQLLGCGGHFEEGQKSTFEVELEIVREKLIKIHIGRDDHAEANRLRAMSARHGRYFHDVPLEALPCLSKSLQAALCRVMKDLTPTNQKTLDPGKSLRITSTNLTLLSKRVDGCMSSEATGFDKDVDVFQRNVFHLAAETGDDHYLRWIFETFKSEGKQLLKMLNARDAFSLTPLMISAYQGSVQAFQLLLDAGADLKERFPDGRTLLSLTAMAGSESIVGEILSRGVKLQDQINYCSPIHDAAASGRSMGIIDILLRHEAEPRYEHPAHEGKCASKVAMEKGHAKIARVLLAAESDLEAKSPIQNDHGRTIENLKRIIGDQLDRSSSPDSVLSSRTTACSSRSTDTGTSNKRQKSHNYDWRNGSPATSSTSSTPRVYASNPMAPSPLGQMTLGTYQITTMGDYSAELDNSLQDYIIYPDADYPHMDLCS